MAVFTLWAKGGSESVATQRLTVDTGTLAGGVSDNFFAAQVEYWILNNGGRVEIRNNTGATVFSAEVTPPPGGAQPPAGRRRPKDR